MIFRLVSGIGLVAGSMLLGWWLHRRRILTEDGASKLVRWVVLVPSPIVLCLSLWRMPLRSAGPWLMPLLGLLIASSTLLPSYWYVKRARLTSPQTGSFLTCAFFSNLGYLGAFVAFALYGEEGYALCMLYLLFFTPCFYTIGFSIAARHGTGSRQTGLADAFNDKLRLYPFLGMVAGIVLNFTQVPRPAWLEPLNHAFIPLSTGLYLAAIGSQITYESPRPWLRPCLAMSFIKLLYTPLVALVLVWLFRVQGLNRFIVLLEASMPVAISPLVLPMLFGLDRKLANALWLFTTIVSIPWLFLTLPALIRLG